MRFFGWIAGWFALLGLLAGPGHHRTAHAPAVGQVHIMDGGGGYPPPPKP